MEKPPPTVKVTFWHFLRDVLVASINKGQFPVAILGLILVIYFVRVPSEVLTEHGREVLSGLKNGYLVGYLSFVSSVAGWYLHTRNLRVKHSEELTRISNEKTELQTKQLGAKIKSSKQK